MSDLAQIQAQALHDARRQLEAIRVTLASHDITLGNPASGVAWLSERLAILETAIGEALALWRAGTGDHMMPLLALSSLLPPTDGNPRPQTLGAALSAFDGSQRALQTALAELRECRAVLQSLADGAAQQSQSHADVLALLADSGVQPTVV